MAETPNFEKAAADFSPGIKGLLRQYSANREPSHTNPEEVPSVPEADVDSIA